MILSNIAAAQVVEKWGTQPITQEELSRAVQRSSAQQQTYELGSSENKIMSRESLSSLLKDPKSRSRKVVFTNGCFDIIHPGHVSYLEKARALGDILVVAVNSDESVKRLKGENRPVVNLEGRMKVLSGLACVDYVTSFGEDTPKETIEAIIPDVLVKGADWDKKDIVGADIVEHHGGKVDTITFVPGQSTTNIVEKIKNS